MDQLLGDAKRLVSRLNHHDNSVDILIAEVTNLQNKLVAMRQYRDEVSKLNDIADHRPRSTLILGSQLENQRIQNLKEENQELSISLAEHQSALELIMNKYREQVLSMMHPSNQVPVEILPRNTEQTIEMITMKERIAEMARIMWESAAIDDNAQIREIEIVRKLQVENENLRELLEISGGHLPPQQQQQQQRMQTSPVVNHSNNISTNQVVSPTGRITPRESSKSSVIVLNEKQSRTEQNSTNNANMFDGSSNCDNDGELLNSFSINKLKKKYSSKKTIFDSMSLYNFDQPSSGTASADSTDAPSSTAEKDSLNKLKQLFIPPENIEKDTFKHENTMNDSLSFQNDTKTDYEDAVDPSDNCFRAIISEFKPMDDPHIDLNEKLYDGNFSQNEESSNNNKNSKTKSEQNTSVDDTSLENDELNESLGNMNKSVIEVSTIKENTSVSVKSNDDTISSSHENEIESKKSESEDGAVENIIQSQTESKKHHIDEQSVASRLDCLDNPVTIDEDDDDSFDDSESSVIECLDSFDSMIEDLEASFGSSEDSADVSNKEYENKSEVLQENEIADVMSFKSEIHTTSHDIEIKKRLDNTPYVESNKSERLDHTDSLVKDNKELFESSESKSNTNEDGDENSALEFLDNFLDVEDSEESIENNETKSNTNEDEDGDESSALEFLDDVLDVEDEEELFENRESKSNTNEDGDENSALEFLDNILDVEDSEELIENRETKSNTNKDEDGDESSVLEFLDDVLDFADNNDYDVDNDDDDEDDDYGDEDCEENFEEDGDSGEDDACDEFTTTCKNNVNLNDSKDNERSSNDIVVAAVKSQNPFSDLFDKKNLITKKEPIALVLPPVDSLTSNGDISDTDSEVTYTEEDVNQALSDFDSFLDFNDDDDDGECDELD